MPQRGIAGFATNIYFEELQLHNGFQFDKRKSRELQSCECFLCSDYRRTRCEKIESEEELKKSKEENGMKNLDEQAAYFQLPNCNYHAGETLFYFCVDCQASMCRICVEVKHKDHRFEPITLAADSARSILKTTKEVLAVRQHSNEKFLSKLLDYSFALRSHREKSLADINQCIKNMHELLDKVKDNLLNDVERLYSMENGRVTSLNEELVLSQQQLHGVSDFLESHEGHDPSEIIQQRYLITDRINQLLTAEKHTNFPLEMEFSPAIQGDFTTDGWKTKAELALKNAVGSIVTNRKVSQAFLDQEMVAKGEVNKGILVSQHTLLLSPHSEHEKVILADKTHRQSVGNKQMLLQSNVAEIPLSRHLLPSLSVDNFSYIYSLDRSSSTVARFFGGTDVARRVYYFPQSKSKPLRICSVGQTGGFAYIDGCSPPGNPTAFALRFVPRSGDRFDLLLSLDKSLFSDVDVGLPDMIPAVCCDQNANIYTLLMENDGTCMIVVYSMSFGSIRKIFLGKAAPQSQLGVRRPSFSTRHLSPSPQQQDLTVASTVNIKRPMGSLLEPPSLETPTMSTTKEEKRQESTCISADFASYFSCCPHMTGTKEGNGTISNVNQCPGLFVVVDTLHNSVKTYDINGALITEIDVPVPLEKISHPRGVAFDYAGNIILCDQGNNRLLLFDHYGRRLRGVLAIGPPSVEGLRRPSDVVTIPGRYQCLVAEETTCVVKLFDYTHLVSPHVKLRIK